MVGQAGAHPAVVDGLADSVDATRPVHAARVLAHVSDAHFQEGAVLIVAAAGDAVPMAADAPNGTVIVMEAGPWFTNLFALYLSVALEPRRAGAVGSVVVWLAVGIHPADVGQAADVLALAVDAGLLVGTVVVMATALYATVVVTNESMEALIVPRAFRLWFISEADHIGVPAMTWQAGAVGMVVDWATQSVAATGTVDTARVLADAVDAGLVTGAPLVSPAPIDAFVAFTDVANGTVSVDVALLCRLHWNGPAFDLGVPEESSLARAHRAVSGNDAKCIDPAGARNVAEVLALAVLAGLAGQALIVSTTALYAAAVFADLPKGALAVSLAAFVSHFNAVSLSVACKSRQAYADGMVVCCAAVGIEAADALEAAGVLAAISDAGLVVGAGIIGAAGVDAGSLLANAPNGAVGVVVAELQVKHDTLNVGVTTESRRAGTDGLVADGEALGVLAANAWAAWVSALAADAGSVKRTVGIAAAALDTIMRLANLAHIAVAVVYAFWCGPSFNLVAEVVRVALVAALASAEWSVNDGAALRVSSARVLNETGVDALRVDAGLVEGAVRVAATPNGAFSPFTDFSRVASRIGGTTVKDADAVAADVSVSAGLVDAALDAHHGGGGWRDGAVDLGVAHFVPRAGTGDPVVLWPAQGVDPAAPPLVARVAAGTLHTGLVVRAVLVHAAPDNAAVADANLLESTILVCVAFH